MVVRLDQDRNYPEFPISHFINEDCFDSNPLAACVRASGGPGADPGCQEHRPVSAACTPGSLVTLETGAQTLHHYTTPAHGSHVTLL